MEDELGKITKLLQRAHIDTDARDELYRHAYDELRRQAQFALDRRPGAELQTTELVNEVYLRLEKSNCLEALSNRRMFFSVAVRAMKHVLIDQYRKRQRRLEGNAAREPLDFLIDDLEEQTDTDFEVLLKELDRLEQESPRQHAVIMHRYFAGLTVAETAELLDVSADTVKRDWRLARVKLSAWVRSYGRRRGDDPA